MKWIKCSDRYPQHLNRILTLTNYGSYNLDWWDDENHMWHEHMMGIRGGRVVAWCEIPEIPDDLMIKPDDPRTRKY